MANINLIIEDPDFVKIAEHLGIARANAVSISYKADNRDRLKNLHPSRDPD